MKSWFLCRPTAFSLNAGAKTLVPFAIKDVCLNETEIQYHLAAAKQIFLTTRCSVQSRIWTLWQTAPSWTKVIGLNCSGHWTEVIGLNWSDHWTDVIALNCSDHLTEVIGLTCSGHLTSWKTWSDDELWLFYLTQIYIWLCKVHNAVTPLWKPINWLFTLNPILLSLFLIYFVSFFPFFSSSHSRVTA